MAKSSLSTATSPKGSIFARATKEQQQQQQQQLSSHAIRNNNTKSTTTSRTTLQFVDHTYTDYSEVPDTVLETEPITGVLMSALLAEAAAVAALNYKDTPAASPVSTTAISASSSSSSSTTASSSEEEVVKSDNNNESNITTTAMTTSCSRSRTEADATDKALGELTKKFGNRQLAAPSSRKNSGGVVQPFPEKLIEVLERGDTASIITWLPHGRSFIVRDTKLFVAGILPRFFRQSKFMSFTRQLNLWGFKRITKGVDSGAYYHELFLRGRAHLAKRMRRRKVKGTGAKLTPNPDEEPDFYALAKVRTLPELPPCVKPLPPLPASEEAGVGAAPMRLSSVLLNEHRHAAATATTTAAGKVSVQLQQRNAAVRNNPSSGAVSAVANSAYAVAAAAADQRRHLQYMDAAVAAAANQQHPHHPICTYPAAAQMHVQQQQQQQQHQIHHHHQLEVEQQQRRRMMMMMAARVQAQAQQEARLKDELFARYQAAQQQQQQERMALAAAAEQQQRGVVNIAYNHPMHAVGAGAGGTLYSHSPYEYAAGGSAHHNHHHHNNTVHQLNWRQQQGNEQVVVAQQQQQQVQRDALYIHQQQQYASGVTGVGVGAAHLQVIPAASAVRSVNPDEAEAIHVMRSMRS